jgi:hypothetical protein
MASSSDPDSAVTVQDLVACVNIIDVCSRRGAFQGTELESVGLLRKKLAKILEAHAPPESEETPVSSTAAAPASTAAAPASTAAAPASTAAAPASSTDSTETPREDAPKKRGKGKSKA